MTTIPNFEQHQQSVQTALTAYLYEQNVNSFNELTTQQRHEFCKQQAEKIISTLTITFNVTDKIHYPIISPPQWTVKSSWFSYGVSVWRVLQYEEDLDEFIKLTHYFYFDGDGKLVEATESKEEDVWRYRLDVFWDLLGLD